MASSTDNVSMALFCDFENVALGVRDANYEKFDIKRVLERLLLKGSIVVKKAYCDWDRYKSFKASMHEANFELIEIPHVRQSGKNSADIRLVVDALDLCYTKSHVDTFVIISGDSDFSPLVSKLRENAKQVIGVGVKQSTSDLLIANCDEFIFYDDLVRESQRAAAKKESRETQSTPKRSPEEEKRRREEVEARKTQAIEFAVQTFEALFAERGDTGKIWASVLKEAMKRRKPDFSESYYGFRAFGNLLDEARSRGLLDFARDEKARTFVFRSNADVGRNETFGVSQAVEPVEAQPLELASEVPLEHRVAAQAEEGTDGGRDSDQPTSEVPQPGAAGGKRRKTGAPRGTGGRKRTRKDAEEGRGTAPETAAVPEAAPAAAEAPPPAPPPQQDAGPVADEAPAPKPRKSPTRTRRPRKPDVAPDAS